jgi:hypothetical protein
MVRIIEEGRIALPPVDQKHRTSSGFGHTLAEGIDLVGIGREDLDRGHIVIAIEIGLRLRQRHEHESRVIFRHADLEHRCDFVGLDAWCRTHRGDRAFGRDQRNRISGMQR